MDQDFYWELLAAGEKMALAGRNCGNSEWWGVKEFIRILIVLGTV